VPIADGAMILRLMNDLPAMPATGAVWDRVSTKHRERIGDVSTVPKTSARIMISK